MPSLARFSLADMIEIGAQARKLGQGTGSLEEAGGAVVRHLRQALVEEDGRSSCPLVRFYATLTWDALEEGQRAFARNLLGGAEVPDDLRCLVLLATEGDEPAWNDRRQSRGHQAIPLPSPEAVAGIPMIAQLIKQFGLEIESVLKPSPELLVDLEQHNFNVFHVEKALGSPYVPAQEDFVVPHGIESVLGFGGMFPTGNLFAVIAFSRVPVSDDVADMFKTLALGVKKAVLPHDGGRVFS